MLPQHTATANTVTTTTTATTAVTSVVTVKRLKHLGQPLLSVHNKSISVYPPVPSDRQHPSYGDCLQVKREYYQNSSVLDCVTQCSQSAAHLREQFLQVQQIRFVTLGPSRCA